MADRLVVFDIDGTLTQTYRVDEACFLDALSETLGDGDVDTDWAAYADATDIGVMTDIFSSRFGRDPDAREVETFVRAFVGKLEATHRADPAAFTAVDGAPALLETLSRADGWSFSIATGGWACSALLKLRLAGIDPGGVPFASCDDARSREHIVLTAIERAKASAGVRRFAHTVLVGDGVWDVRTARRLDLPFLGIGDGEKAEGLRRAGASAVIADFAHTSEVLALLSASTVPGRSG